MPALDAVRQRGFALLLVLWTVVLLALLGTQITASGRTEAQLADNIAMAAAAEAEADGAVFEGVFHLLDSSGQHWFADGVPRTIRHGAYTIELRLFNEAGKVNLNTVQPELLAALIHAVGTDTRTATALALAIVDWRFVDAQRSGGAKLDVYRAAGRLAGPPGAPFRSLAELGLVLGITPELLARLEPHLTLFHDGQPSPAVADPVVRRALHEAAPDAPEDSSPADETVVSISARVEGPRGTRFNRRAAVRLGQQSNGALFQVLVWGTDP